MVSWSNLIRKFDFSLTQSEALQSNLCAGIFTQIVQSTKLTSFFKTLNQHSESFAHSEKNETDYLKSSLFLEF